MLMVSIIILCLCPTTITAMSNCSCGYYDEVDWVGPFCARWVDDDGLHDGLTTIYLFVFYHRMQALARVLFSGGMKVSTGLKI